MDYEIQEAIINKLIDVLLIMNPHITSFSFSKKEDGDFHITVTLDCCDDCKK